ncbi:MAG: glycosyltransferase family 4 protein [Candidatus Helarchaeota archaeon]
MKIAIIRTTLLKGSGQVRVINEVSKRLRKRGHVVNIFSREIFDPIPFSRKIPVLYDRIPVFRGVTFGLKAGLILKEFDIIHTQYHPGIFTGNVARAFRRKPHVSTYHGFAPISQFRSAKKRLKMIDHRIGHFLHVRMGVDHFMPVSNYLREELIKDYGVPEEKVTTVYNGIDLDRFNPNNSGDIVREKYNLEGHKVVLFLGRLAPYKGIQYLMNAVPKVLKEVPNVKFVIAGSAREDVLNLKDMITRLGIAKAMVFTGFVPDDEVPQLYAAPDVFCYPSMWEGFGLTPAEANSSGVPVVAFKHCAIPEVIKDGKTGILVPPRNHEKMAEALIYLLQDEKIARKMGMEGRKRVERLFTWDKTVDNTIKIYEKYFRKENI